MKTLTLTEEEASDLGQILRYSCDIFPHMDLRKSARRLLNTLLEENQRELFSSLHIPA